MSGLEEEAERRGYRFDTTKILKPGVASPIEETEGQLLFEWIHLKEKLQKRAPILHQQFRSIIIPEPHPLFQINPGEIREWERR